MGFYFVKYFVHRILLIHKDADNQYDYDDDDTDNDGVDDENDVEGDDRADVGDPSS